MSVLTATKAELERLGCVDSVEGQIALNLAGVMDDRAGIQGGGVASTAKQLGLIMAELRAQHKPRVVSNLDRLRNSA